MTITLTVSNITSTSASINASNIGASGSVEIQLAPRKSFDFTPSPIIVGAPLGSGGSNSYTVNGLNQSGRYFARARTRLSSGVAEAWSNVFGFYTPLAAAQQGQSRPIVMQPALVVVPDPIMSISGLANGSGSVGEISGYPASNLTIDSPVSWQSFSPTGSYGLIFNVTGSPIDTIALLRTNLPENATISIYGAATQSALLNLNGTPIVTNAPFRASANLPGRTGGYHGLFRLPSPQSYPWYEITISGLPAGGFLSAEHMIAGLSRVSKTVSIGMTEQGASLGSLDRNRAGIADRQDGYQIRHVEFDLSYVGEVDFQTKYRDLAFRTNEPILIVPNAIADGFLHDRILYGTLGAGKSQLASSIHQTKSFVIDSII